MLIEAKANAVEFVTPPCGAAKTRRPELPQGTPAPPERGRDLIENTLNQVKRHLPVSAERARLARRKRPTQIPVQPAAIPQRPSGESADHLSRPGVTPHRISRTTGERESGAPQILQVQNYCAAIE